MGYSLQPDLASRNRTPASSFRTPKTLTPGPRLQQRGRRYYSPGMGRWLSNDPIGISGGLNQYVFCANSPVNWRDPFGLTAMEEALYSMGIERVPTPTPEQEEELRIARQGMAAWVDGLDPFGNPLSDYYVDECGNVPMEFRYSRYAGEVSGLALTFAVDAGITRMAAGGTKAWQALSRGDRLLFSLGWKGAAFRDAPSAFRAFLAGLTAVEWHGIWRVTQGNALDEGGNPYKKDK